MTPGYIYILTNPSLQNGYVKIGRTENDPSERAAAISSGTGVPMKYDVAYKEFVPDCFAVEREIHDRLSTYRVSDNREFFQIPLEEAIQEVHKAAEQSRSQSPFCNTCESRKSLGQATLRITQLEQKLSRKESQIEQELSRWEFQTRQIQELEKKIHNLKQKIRRKREQKIIQNVATVANLFTHRLNALLCDVFVWYSSLIPNRSERLWWALLPITILIICGIFSLMYVPMLVIAIMMMLLIVIGLSAIHKENNNK